MNKKKRKKIKKITFVLILIITIAIVGLIISQSIKSGYYADMFREPVKISVTDKCSVVMGNLFHEIKNKDECRIECRNTCILHEKDFVSSEFIEKPNSCHECNCYCK